MTTETNTPQDALFTALSKAQGLIRVAGTNSTNPHYKSKYANLESAWEACREALTKNDLCVIQTTRLDAEKNHVLLTTTLGHKSGQSVSSDYPLWPIKNDPQGFGSALTYARRYCLMAIVGIAPGEDEDDDANLACQPPKIERPKPSGQPSPIKPKAPQPEPEDSFENASEFIPIFPELVDPQLASSKISPTIRNHIIKIAKASGWYKGGGDTYLLDEIQARYSLVGTADLTNAQAAQLIKTMQENPRQ